MLTVAVLLFALIGAHCQDIPVLSVNDPNNITIAYGSCTNTFDEDEDIRQIFGSISAVQPDVWMWIGDAVYLDGDSFFFGALPGEGYDTADEQYVRDIFNTLKENSAYAELVNNTQIIGTWDDHDYAYDSANKTFEYKERNKGIYLDFLDEPENSTRREQNGIYSSYYVGEDRLIKVILLDVRYNRDEESTTTNLIDVDTTETFDDMLGEEQWEWLDGQLDDNATYTLVVSATQILPDDRPILPNWFENSKERLLDLINTKQKSGVVFITGDVHFAEIVQHPCPGRVGYNQFYEFTSSGMTHSADFVDIFDGVVDTYSKEEDRYFERNFATLRFTREANSTDPPTLVFEARDADGNVVLTREVSHSDLVYNETVANNYTGCEDISDEEGEMGEEEEEDFGDDIIDSAENVIDEVGGDDEGDEGEEGNAGDDIIDRGGVVVDEVGDILGTL